MFSPELNCPPPDLEEMVQLNRMLPECLAHDEGRLPLPQLQGDDLAKAS